MTLIELLISFLVLAIVCVGWLQIIGIQSAKREARRREAVERLAGIMDAFMECYKDTYVPSKIKVGSYEMSLNQNVIGFRQKVSGESVVYPMFDSDISPIGFQLSIVTTANLTDAAAFGSNWGNAKKWLVGKLYNQNGDLTTFSLSDQTPFFVLPVCLGL